MKIFIDVDNTIIEHYGFYTPETESRVHKGLGNFPKENELAIKYMYDASVCHDPLVLKKLLELDNVYILTKYYSIEYESEKQKRVANLFNLTQEELLNSCDSNGIPKYIAVGPKDTKVGLVKKLMNVDSMENYILIDDYSQNIIDWELEHGIGIKYYNEYNSPQHPTNGITISNFKIFEFYMGHNLLKNIFLVGQNKYKASYIASMLTKEFVDVQRLDLLSFLLEDVTGKLRVDSLDENHKYNYFQFLVEYYNFMDHLDSNYWQKKVFKQINNNKLSIVISNFEPMLKNVFKVEKKVLDSTISMNVLSSTGKTPANVYDVYLTVNDKYLNNQVGDDFQKVCHSLNKLLGHKNFKITN